MEIVDVNYEFERDRTEYLEMIRKQEKEINFLQVFRIARLSRTADYYRPVPSSVLDQQDPPDSAAGLQLQQPRPDPARIELGRRPEDVGIAGFSRYQDVAACSR